MANDMHLSHYTNLRKSHRMNWSTYDQNMTIAKSGQETNQIEKGMLQGIRTADCIVKKSITNACVNFWHAKSSSNSFIVHINARSYSTANQSKNNANSETDKKDNISSSSSTPAEVPLTRADKLKKAVKEYGSTVIIFHVGISLISLGSFYLLVSRYVL